MWNWRGMPTIWGVTFLGGAETLERKGRNICGINSLMNSLRNLWAIFPKIHQTKTKHSPQIPGINKYNSLRLSFVVLEVLSLPRHLRREKEDNFEERR